MNALKIALISLIVCIGVLWVRDEWIRTEIRNACYQAERSERIEQKARYLWKYEHWPSEPDGRAGWLQTEWLPTADSQMGRAYACDREQYRARVESQVP
jgi:hypothetical protein